MPQMAHLNLFILFVMTFLIMSTLNYFLFTYDNSQKSTDKKTSKLTWKW